MLSQRNLLIIFYFSSLQNIKTPGSHPSTAGEDVLEQEDVEEDNESDEEAEDGGDESDEDEDEKVKQKLLNDQVQESAGKSALPSNTPFQYIRKTH